LGIPFCLCSCQTVEKVKEFARTEAIREYVEKHPLDVTLVSEKAGATLNRYVDSLKQFLTRFLGLENLPIHYSGQTAVEAEVKPHLRVKARNFSISDLPVRELEVHTPTVHLSVARVFSERNFRFVSQSRFPTWITLDAEGLTAYITKKQPQFQDFSLKLRANRVEIRMTYPFLGIPMPIQVAGRLEVRDKAQIHLVEPAVTVQGQRLADQAAQAIVGQFNPVFDVARDLRLPVGLELDGIETKDEVVVLQGHLVWEGKVPSGAAPQR
jgi:hypothetical protein